MTKKEAIVKKILDSDFVQSYEGNEELINGDYYTPTILYIKDSTETIYKLDTSTAEELEKAFAERSCPEICKARAIAAVKNTGRWYVHSGKEGVLLSSEENGRDEFYSFAELSYGQLVEAVEDDLLRPLYLEAYGGGQSTGEEIMDGLMRNVENTQHSHEVWETVESFRLEAEEIAAEEAQAEVDEAEAYKHLEDDCRLA